MVSGPHWSMAKPGGLHGSSPSMQRSSNQSLHQMQSLQQRVSDNVQWWHAHQEMVRISHGKLGKLHAGSHGDLWTVTRDR